MTGLRLGFAAFAGLAGCASRPVGPPPIILSPAVDIETLLPPPPPPVVVPSHLKDFDDIRVPGGRFQGLPSGILISDVAHAQCMRAKQQRETLRVETGVLHQLRKQERSACEGLLQDQRSELILRDRALQSAQRWATVKLAMGIALGIVVGFAGGRLGR